MANRARGEISIKFDGCEQKLVPDFLAIAEAEDKAGIGFNGILLKCFEKKHGVREIAAVIYAGLLGSGVKKYSYQDVGKIILRDGMSGHAGPAIAFVQEALTGGQEESEVKNEDAGTK